MTESKSRTITKKELVSRISEETNQTKVAVKQVLQKFLDTIIDELAHENRLEFRDFGVLEVRERAARRAQNPRTVEMIKILATADELAARGLSIDEVCAEMNREAEEKLRAKGEELKEEDRKTPAKLESIRKEYGGLTLDNAKVQVPAKRVVKFKVGRTMQDCVDSGLCQESVRWRAAQLYEQLRDQEAAAQEEALVEARATQGDLVVERVRLALAKRSKLVASKSGALASHDEEMTQGVKPCPICDATEAERDEPAPSGQAPQQVPPRSTGSQLRDPNAGKGPFH